jgi:hypothetical protein
VFVFLSFKLSEMLLRNKCCTLFLHKCVFICIAAVVEICVVVVELKKIMVRLVDGKH